MFEKLYPLLLIVFTCCFFGGLLWVIIYQSKKDPDRFNKHNPYYKPEEKTGSIYRWIWAGAILIVAAKLIVTFLRD
jgi:ABC-type glycerol-3-phosphate transport system permease component